MSRIPYLTAKELSAEQRCLAEHLAASRGGRLVGPGAFWLRNPALAAQADAWRLLMERHTSLPNACRNWLFSLRTATLPRRTPGAGIRRRRHVLVLIVP